MMVQIDFRQHSRRANAAQGLALTLAVNWLIKPFSMFAIAWLFLLVIFAPLIPANLGREYLAGAILLGAAPCTAMVFVWSYLTKGDPAYTLVQVSVNDLIMLVAFAPIVALLLGLSDIVVPWNTLFLSVVLYIVVPLKTRAIYDPHKDALVRECLPTPRPLTITGLLLTLILLFSFQGEVLSSPLHS